MEKAAGLVLAAGRSSARFTKPLKTHSRALLAVASSSSNTTRFTTADRGRRSARLERQRPLRRPGRNDGSAVIRLACAPARLDIPYTYNNILILPALSQFIGDLGGYDPESFSKRTSCEQGIPDQVRDEDFYSLFLDAEWNNKITA